MLYNIVHKNFSYSCLPCHCNVMQWLTVKFENEWCHWIWKTILLGSIIFIPNNVEFIFPSKGFGSLLIVTTALRPLVSNQCSANAGAAHILAKWIIVNGKWAGEFVYPATDFPRCLSFFIPANIYPRKQWVHLSQRIMCLKPPAVDILFWSTLSRLRELPSWRIITTTPK